MDGGLRGETEGFHGASYGLSGQAAFRGLSSRVRTANDFAGPALRLSGALRENPAPLAPKKGQLISDWFSADLGRPVRSRLRLGSARGGRARRAAMPRGCSQRYRRNRAAKVGHPLLRVGLAAARSTEVVFLGFVVSLRSRGARSSLATRSVHLRGAPDGPFYKVPVAGAAAGIGIGHRFGDR